LSPGAAPLPIWVEHGAHPPWTARTEIVLEPLCARSTR
jgi:hypothetical protein